MCAFTLPFVLCAKNRLPANYPFYFFRGPGILKLSYLSQAVNYMLNHEFLNIHRGENSNLQDSTDMGRINNTVNLGREGEVYLRNRFHLKSHFRVSNI